MTDIVERLRKVNTPNACGSDFVCECEDCSAERIAATSEAVKEIEHLRSRLAEAEALLRETADTIRFVAKYHPMSAGTRGRLNSIAADMSKTDSAPVSERAKRLAEANAAFEAEQTEKWAMAGKLAAAEALLREARRKIRDIDSMNAAQFVDEGIGLSGSDLLRNIDAFLNREDDDARA